MTLIEKMRNAIRAEYDKGHGNDETMRYAAAAAKVMLDDMREWNKNPEKDRPGFRYAYFVADIDAYEKDRSIK